MGVAKNGAEVKRGVLLKEKSRALRDSDVPLSQEAQQGARANDHGCHDPCSEQHEVRQTRSWLILNVNQKPLPMKTPIKYVVVSAAIIVVAALYGQQKADAEFRIARLQESFEQLKKAPRSMEQALPAQDRLLEQIVAEVIFLHRENSALKREIEALKSKR